MEAHKQDVGIVIGRFQVAELHAAHKALLDFALSRHDSVFVFLGNAEARATRNNPLEYKLRRGMIEDEYPQIDGVHYIADMESDEEWSAKLDKQIARLTKPGQGACLYGGRDGFIEHYHGKHPTVEWESKTHFNTGTEAREQIAYGKNENDVQLRRGAILGAYSRFPVPHFAVDVAILSEDDKRILLVRKHDEHQYRLAGGFCEPVPQDERGKGWGYLAANARREAAEETGVVITDPVVVDSRAQDDWRYRQEVDCIITVLQKAHYQSGPVRPGDKTEIAEAAWFEIEGLASSDIVPNHRDLILRALELDHYPGDSLK